MCIFLHLIEPKKTCIDILRRSVTFSARELRSETTSCIFGWCPYQNTPRLSWSLHIKKNMGSGTISLLRSQRRTSRRQGRRLRRWYQSPIHCQMARPYWAEFYQQSGHLLPRLLANIRPTHSANQTNQNSTCERSNGWHLHPPYFARQELPKTTWLPLLGASPLSQRRNMSWD